MGKLRIMSRRGDDTLVWNQQAAVEGDEEAAQAIREAERLFNEQHQRGATAFQIETGKLAKPVDRFEPTAEQIVIVPRVVGG